MRIATFVVSLNLDTRDGHALCTGHPDARAVSVQTFARGSAAAVIDALDTKIATVLGDAAKPSEVDGSDPLDEYDDRMVMDLAARGEKGEGG
jgi:hypothetical protein